MKLLKTIGLSAAILLTSASGVVKTSSSANAKVLKNWVIEKKIVTPSLKFPKQNRSFKELDDRKIIAPSLKFLKQKNKTNCYDFSKDNTCYKGYKHF